MEKKDGAVKKKSTRIVAGYDLSDAYAQISYCTLDGEEPETLATVTGTELYNIPVVLCKRNEVNQWFYGKEAVKAAQQGNGILIRNLVTLARKGAPVEVGEESFDPIALLTLFVKRSLSIVGLVAMPDYLEGIIFTTDNLDKRMVEVLGKMAANLHLKTDRIYFQSHVESFYYYTLYQPRELWTLEVLLCDYDGSRMKIYALNTNKLTTPAVLYINIENYPLMRRMDGAGGLDEMEKDRLDQQFLDIVKEKFGERTISCVYLIGDGYKDEWARRSLRYLCMGRRVFRGNNLYSKGACYGIREKMGLRELSKAYVFLGLDKLKANIGMRVLREGLDAYYAVMDAGTNWFEAGKEFDVILEDGNGMSMLLTPLNGKEPREIHMIFEGLPERPKRTTRLHVAFEMTSETQISIMVKDMGFGELFPASDGEWIKLFEI